jgi:hypothetical protein
MAHPSYLPTRKVSALLSDMESDGTAMDPAAAAEQLAALQSGRAQMAERAMQPWWYQALLGLLVFGLREGRTRKLIGVWFVGYAVVLAAGCAAEHLLDWRGAMVATGAVLGVAIALVSHWWTRMYVAELREAL